jgi:hypothetical protein
MAGSGTDTGASLTLADLTGLPDEAARRQRLLDAAVAEAGKLAQSRSLAINGVKDNQTLFFGDAGLVIYQGDAIPDRLAIQLWVIESDADIRSFALDADRILDSEEFKGLFTAVEAAMAIASPILAGAIAVGGMVTSLLRQKLRANKDDLAGYWQTSLIREQDYPHGARDRQDYPHGARDRQDVYDTTGNIMVDYTLFGFEKTIENGN